MKQNRAEFFSFPLSYFSFSFAYSVPSSRSRKSDVILQADPPAAGHNNRHRPARSRARMLEKMPVQRLAIGMKAGLQTILHGDARDMIVAAKKNERRAFKNFDASLGWRGRNWLGPSSRTEG